MTDWWLVGVLFVSALIVGEAIEKATKVIASRLDQLRASTDKVADKIEMLRFPINDISGHTSGINNALWADKPSGDFVEIDPDL